MEVKYDSLLGEMREGDSAGTALPDTASVENGSRLVVTSSGVAWRYGDDNTDLPDMAGIDIDAEPDKLYSLVMPPGRTRELYISAGGNTDFDFGVLIVQGGTVGSLVIESEEMMTSPLFPDDSVPPRFAAANPPPSISTPLTGYMFRFHWDAFGHVLLGNLAYTEEVSQ